MEFMVSQKGIEIDPAKIQVILKMPTPSGIIEVQYFLEKLNFISRFITQITQVLISPKPMEERTIGLDYRMPNQL